MLVFSTQLCELLPLSPSLWFNSPPLPCVNKYTVYTFTKLTLHQSIITFQAYEMPQEGEFRSDSLNW
jgi:hypothetical protein